MSNVKTAISLPETLFQDAEAIASKMKVSRSKLIAIALEEFLTRYHNRQLLAQINAAYDDSVVEDKEQAVLRSMRRHHRRLVEGEW
jgi:metal-responsive CopG/Arc/MetJ family transcriptional regulator